MTLWLRFVLLLALSLLLIATVGCTAIDTGNPPPQDFPRLTVKVIRGHGGEVFDACYKFVPLSQRLIGAIPEGCAYLDFVANTCTVWVRSDYPSPRVLEHELLHCRGYSHFGETNIADAWIQYRDEMRRLGK